VTRLRPMLLIAAVLAALVGAPAPAMAASSLVWSATVDGRDLASATSGRPLVLHPSTPAKVGLDLANTGSSDITIRSLRLEGRVMGMGFFSFTTRIDSTVHAGESTHRDIELDLGDLDGQAVGSIPARLELLSPSRKVIDSRALVTDVRGSVTSVYGTFGLVVSLVTLALALGLVFAIARRRLPVNRWQRAARFLPVGVGLGLTATFTLSSTRMLTPNAMVWAPTVLGCATVAFLIGYVTPTPDDDLAPASADAYGWSYGAGQAAPQGQPAQVQPGYPADVFPPQSDPGRMV
jgi:hypothetical protein